MELSGTSTYALDADGKFAAHDLSDLRLDGRRLPSSTLAEVLALAQRRSGTSSASAAVAGAGGASPVEILGLLAQALQQPPADAAADADADASDGVAAWPPPPGGEAWARL